MFIPWEFATVTWKCDKCGWIGRFDQIGRCEHEKFTVTKEPILTEREKRKEEIKNIIKNEEKKHKKFWADIFQK